MKMPAPEHDNKSKMLNNDQKQVQRQIEDEKEEALQPKPLANSISRTNNPDSSGAKVDPETASQIKSIKGGGQPLPASEQRFFGSRFGADFSGVRVHTGIKAAELADNIRAKAFTTGNDIFFNQGQYSPESYEDRKLLAHELSHTIQQNEVQAKSMVQRKSKKKKIPEYELYRIYENESWWKYYIQLL